MLSRSCTQSYDRTNQKDLQVTKKHANVFTKRIFFVMKALRNK